MRKVTPVLAGVAVLGALVFFGFVAPGHANENGQDTCLRAVAGVYLNIVGNPPLSSSLVTISAQGVIETTDSDQDGDAGSFDPFSAAHGVLTSCRSANNGSYRVKGYTLDYGWPELAGHAGPGRCRRHGTRELRRDDLRQRARRAARAHVRVGAARRRRSC